MRRELGCFPAEYRHHLRDRRSVFCRYHGADFAQTMRGAMVEPGLIASLPKPVAEAIRRERPSLSRFEECLHARRRGVEVVAQGVEQRDRKDFPCRR